MRPAAAGGLAGWTAAGVRHAVLLRVLPTLRHDFATPISVVRMSALVLQRKLAAVPVDAAYCSQRAVLMGDQADALSQTMRLLLGWGTGPSQGSISRRALVSGCVALLRPLFGMGGTALEVGPALSGSPTAAEPMLQDASALRYLLLASMCYLQDTQPDLACIAIEPERDDALLLQPSRRVPQTQAQAVDYSVNDEVLRIDAPALEHLAADLGRSVRHDNRGLRIGLLRD